MAEKQIMYRVPSEHSNAARRYGIQATAVSVKVGSRYITDETGNRYQRSEPHQDANGSVYYAEYDPEYGGEYKLFEERSAAEKHILQKQKVRELLNSQNSFYKLSLEHLLTILDILNRSIDD